MKAIDNPLVIAGKVAFAMLFQLCKMAVAIALLPVAIVVCAISLIIGWTMYPFEIAWFHAFHRKEEEE